jgi:uncharacterized delta-60 repeat protein
LKKISLSKNQYTRKPGRTQAGTPPGGSRLQSRPESAMLRQTFRFYFSPQEMLIMNIRPLLLCAFFFAALSSQAAATALDPHFGEDGRVAVELGSEGSRANAVLVQPDGKILAAGSSSSETGRDFMLFRLLPDGSLDPDFNQNGTVVTAVSPSDDEVLTLALQADGKIIAAGYSSNGKNRDFAIVRYNSDGSPDSGFGAAGMVVTAVGGSHDEVTDVAVQADGSIIITGAAQGANGRVAVLARYSADGKPDASFGEEGFTLSVVGVDAQAESVALGEGGRILLSGTYSDGQRSGLMLLGFDKNGRLDKEFGEQGIAVPADSSVFSEGYGMFVNEDGTILVAGSVGGEGERDAALFRFTADGQPDSGFEDNGVLVSQAGPEDDVLYDAAVVEGNVAAAGFKTVGGQREFLLAVYKQNEAGGLTADLLTTGFSSNDTATALAAAEGGLVAVGESIDAAASKAAVSKYTVEAEQTGYAQVMVDGAVLNTGENTLVDSSSQYVVTGLPYEVTRTTAIIPAEVLSGAGSVSERGIVFSTTPDPAYSGGSSSNGDAPILSDLSPQGTFDNGTVTLQARTDVNASCKYDDTAGTAYDQMENSLSTEDGKLHLKTLTSVAVGEYTYHVRCKNTSSGAVNTTDGIISFKVTSSGTPATTGATGSGTIGGSITVPPTVPTGGSTPTSVKISESMPDQFNVKDPVLLQVTTSDAATCKYSTSANSIFEGMTDFSVASDGGRNHSSLIKLDIEEYQYYVRCKDDYDNSNEITINFIVTPVVITETTPSAFSSTADVKLTVITDVDATCKYDTTAGTSYDEMEKTFSTTGAKTHSQIVSELEARKPYTYYARCKNTATGAVNTTDTVISFTVTAALTPSSDALFTSSEQLINTALQNVGRFFISSAFAQTTGTTGATGTTGSTSTTATTTSSGFVEEGTIKMGSGTGRFSSKLTKLKPGTVFYARAYAVIGGVTHHGKQVSFRTADSCFVATAAFGSVFHPAVQVLRDFRDQFLNRSAAGQALVELYYRTSPPLADFVSQHDSLRFAARLLLLPVTGVAWLALHFGAAGLLLPAGAALSLLLLTGRRRKTQGRAAIR